MAPPNFFQNSSKARSSVVTTLVGRATGKVLGTRIKHGVGTKSILYGDAGELLRFEIEARLKSRYFFLVFIQINLLFLKKQPL